jgi:DNA recombination protein RmuC
MLIPVELLLILVGLVVGTALGWFAARSRAAVDVAKLEATLQATRDGEARLESSLRSLTYEARAQTQDAVADAVTPLHDALLRYERRVADLERDRVGAYESLREQVRAMHDVSGELRTETRQLVSALRAPQIRGRWGEHQLRRIVEAAGMLEHCDFDEQVTATTDSGVVRPDLVVRLHGGRQVVVDAKAPFEGYLSAMEARDEAGRTAHLTQHAKHLRGHVDALSAKAYWDAFEPAPEFVVLFMPADTFLDAALQHDPALLEHAFSRNVVLATPATLVALLRTIAYAWRQESLAHNALAVHRTGRELYARLTTMGDHFAKLGSALGTAVSSYNKAVGSLEARVLVSARRLAELGISADLLPAPPQVELTPRHLQPQDPVTSTPDTAAPDTAAPDTSAHDAPAHVAPAPDASALDAPARVTSAPDASAPDAAHQPPQTEPPPVQPSPVQPSPTPQTPTQQTQTGPSPVQRSPIQPSPAQQASTQQASVNAHDHVPPPDHSATPDRHATPDRAINRTTAADLSAGPGTPLGPHRSDRPHNSAPVESEYEILLAALREDPPQ